jgi:hypothetical protein
MESNSKTYWVSYIVRTCLLVNRKKNENKCILSRIYTKSIMLAHERLSKLVPFGRLVPGPAQRSGPTSLLVPPSLRHGFLKNKKHNDISFPHCRTHATAAGASTLSPTHRWHSPTWRPSPAMAFPFGRHTPTPPSCCHAPMPRRSLPPVACATCPTEPSRMLPAMVVVVVLTRCRLWPRWLESPSPGLPHVANACFKRLRCFVGMFQVFHVDVAKVNRDVVYVAMIVHICCKCLFPMFHLF